MSKTNKERKVREIGKEERLGRIEECILDLALVIDDIMLYDSEDSLYQKTATKLFGIPKKK